MKILIVYSRRENTPFNENVSNAQVEAMQSALSSGGWRVGIASYQPKAISEIINSHRPDVIFNLVYGYRNEEGDVMEYQPDSTARLEQFGIPLTGASAKAQYIAQDKLEIIPSLNGSNVLSPKVFTSKNSHEWPGIGIVKPRYGACHRDVLIIKDKNIFDGMILREKELICQEYIDGPEFTVAVVVFKDQICVLPPISVDFGEDVNEPHVMDRSLFKWTYNCIKDDTYGLKEVAIRTFLTLNLKDYARLDFRISRKGPVLLDANALPNLEPRLSLLPKAAHFAGISYRDLVLAIADACYHRYFGSQI